MMCLPSISEGRSDWTWFMVLSRSFPLVARIVACSAPRGAICASKAVSADIPGLDFRRSSTATLMAQLYSL